ncbi:MAG TPA: cysteine hydrolase [Dehalococcoidia bacterium]|nr:cysteine hydrolase [Dehalococcoidia bacterium]
MVEYEVIPERTAILVFDMINDFVDPRSPGYTSGADQMALRLKDLLDLCRSKGVLVVYASESLRPDGLDWGRLGDIWERVGDRKILMEGTEGVEIYKELEPKPGDIVIKKHRYSAFYGTELELVLRGRGADTLIVSGVSLVVGCDTTVRDAFNRDLKVILLSDGCELSDLPDQGWGAVPKEVARRVYLTTVARAFGQVMSIDELTQKLSLS